MKSRSYKLSPNDDWVEESWTVDCVCGVNFDDGEEMVNCDDCGVWVHTRCSRYVKSEKSFACDKCKNRNTRNNSEETEVAQLLVELPTKTLRMENPTSFGPPRLPSATTLAPAYIRPCRLWTDNPIKERVHIQGIPGVGDDPSLFSGVSSVFGPQLWKCAGYVPKKFNFPYKDCPYWEEVEEDVHKKNGAVSQHRADNTVGVLVSSNSEIPSDPPEDLEGVETKNGEVDHDKLETVELATKLDSTISEVSKPYLGVRKDQILLQSSHFQSGKRKENYEMIKDRSGKKKARTMENHGEFKKKNNPASTNSSDVKELQWHEERGHAAQKDDPQGSSKNCLKEQSLDASTNHSTSKEITKEGQSESPVPEKSEDLSKTILNAASLLEHRDSWGISSEVQVAGNSDANTSKFEGRLPTGVRINSNKSEIVSKDVVINHTKVQADINKGLQDNNELNVQPSPAIDPNSKTRGIQTQSEEIYADCPINSARVNDPAFTALKSCTKAEDVSRGFKIENRQRDAADDVSPVAHHQPRLDKGGSQDYLGAKNSSKEYDWKILDEPLKSNGSMRGPSLANGESELVASVGTSSSISAAVSPKSSAFGSCISASANYEDTNVKLKKNSESNVCSYKDYGNNAVPEVVKGEGSPERPKILLTKLIRSSHGSVTKSTQTKKVFHSSNSKRTFTDSREPTSRSANTLSPVPTLSASAQPSDASILQPEIASDVEKKASSLQSETASSLSKKATGSVLFQKGEKINQPVPQMSSKVNTSLTHVATSSNSPATLSDEELALLLHQELNSSPRVPRVPRMRHAGSLPQLTSPTASSMMKRTSSAGGKEHGLAPRRRDKEFPKDNSHGLRDGDDETKKTEWAPSLSDHGGQDSGWTLRLARDLGNGPAKGVLCMKRSTAAASSATTSSSPVEATEHSSSVNRSRNPSADDNMVVSRSAPRTLPGLIAEIMSKGQRMTYEELCNAVLPHWPNLRKHNGERYAYSSHSQAVLDCLRNRNEWARLVDRGPKTCVGRKRRKPDSDLPDIDSEDNDDSRDKTAKSYRSKSIESSHEEFPKGKRKARKWTLKGRVASRSRRRLEEFSDDEADSYLNSSEDASVSEDEIQGGVTPVDGAEVSKSSNGIESM